MKPFLLVLPAGVYVLSAPIRVVPDLMADEGNQVVDGSAFRASDGSVCEIDCIAAKASNENEAAITAADVCRRSVIALQDNHRLVRRQDASLARQLRRKDRKSK